MIASERSSQVIEAARKIAPRRKLPRLTRQARGAAQAAPIGREGGGPPQPASLVHPPLLRRRRGNSHEAFGPALLIAPREAPQGSAGTENRRGGARNRSSMGWGAGRGLGCRDAERTCCVGGGALTSTEGGAGA